MSMMGIIDGPVPAVAGYQGPGDVVASASGWWGLRAYNAASIGGNCVDIIRASDSMTQTFVSLTDGTLDVASITTFLNATTGKVTKLWDQTGNGHHIVQASDVVRPAFTLNALGSRPAITFTSGNVMKAAATTFATTQPYTLSATLFTNAVVGTVLINENGGTVLGLYTSSTQIQFTAGTTLSATETVNNWYAVQALANGASSTLYINGTATNGNAGSSNWASAGTINTGNDQFSDAFTGKIAELGVWNSGFNGTQQSNMNSNQRTYWGF